MIRSYLESVGLAAEGFSGWAAAQPVLRGTEPWRAAAATPYVPKLLPANERRRATPAILQAFRASEDALALSARDLTQLATVFASADAEMAVLNRICTALSRSPRLVSPTDFHNSVHNAASGYFGIAIRSMMPATTVAAYDHSFAAGLLEAATLVMTEQCAALLVAYDVMAPAPLWAARPLAASASCALLLSPARSPATLAELTVGLAEGDSTPCASASLEPLRRACPALRALPLLELLARGHAGTIRLALGPARALTVACT